MNREVYRHLLASYGKRPALWFSFGAEAIRAFIGRVVTVLLLARMVTAVADGDLETAQTMVLLWAGLTIFANVLASTGELVALWAENQVYASSLEGWYKRLTNKDMKFYRDNQAGYLSAMFRQYLDGQLLMVRMLRGDILRTFISLVFPVIVLLAISWQIGVMTLLIVLTQGGYMVWTSKKANKYRAISNKVYREISGEVADDLTNIVAYKASGQEVQATKRMVELRKKETHAFWMRRKTTVLLDFPRSVATILLVGVVFWLALNNTNPSVNTIGLLVLTITYMFQILRNVADLPDIIYRHDDLIARVEPTLFVLSDEHETIRDTDDSVQFSPEQAQIEFKDVSFKYTDDDASEHVFKHLNLVIQGGEKVGIVGLSGAGKSTLASLIMRFDDITAGEILIDGVNIQSISQSSLRQQVAYVPQEPLLFHRSITDNIAYHNDTATKADIVAAAKAAHAHEFIAELPKGYDTVVGERGVKLSGGQKQRVVIARAILKQAPILLFDEATSALDSESEHTIQQALPEITGNHTAIIIAHRLSTIAGLDRVIVMEQGKIVEEGTHKQLLAKKGRYHALWQRQTSNHQ